MDLIRNRLKNAHDSGYRGLTLEDVAGSIRKDISYWAIDESGNPSRKRTEDGKAFTMAAVTELSKVNYGRLLNGVPLYSGEVHFSRLRNEHPEICIRLMTDFGKEDIRIVYKTIQKRWKSTTKKERHVPVDELYLFAILTEILNAIQIIDDSDLIIAIYDDNTNIRQETCYMLWNDRCILYLGKSEDFDLTQAADMCASSIGRKNLSGGMSESIYFDKIEAKSVDISKGLVSCTQHLSFAPIDDDNSSKYKSTSTKGRSDDKDESVRNKNKKCNRITSCRSTRYSPVTNDNKHYRYKTASTNEKSDDKDGSVRSKNKKSNKRTNHLIHSILSSGEHTTKGVRS